MTGVDSETGIVSGAGGFDIRRDSSFAVGGICFGVGLGVEFDAVGTCACGCKNGVAVGGHENRNTYVGGMKAFYHIAKKVEIGFHVPAGR